MLVAKWDILQLIILISLLIIMASWVDVHDQFITSDLMDVQKYVEIGRDLIVSLYLLYDKLLPQMS